MFRLPVEWITHTPYSVHTWMDAVSVNYSLLPWPWLYLPFLAFLFAPILLKDTRAIIIFTVLIGLERIFGVTMAGFLLIGAGIAWSRMVFRREQTDPAVKWATVAALGVLVGAILLGFPRVVSLSPRGCQANLKNVRTAIEMYQTDWDGEVPSSLTLLTPNYLKTIPQCPADLASESNLSLTVRPDSYIVSCDNGFHKSAQGKIEPLVVPLSRP